MKIPFNCYIYGSVTSTNKVCHSIIFNQKTTMWIFTENCEFINCHSDSVLRVYRFQNQATSNLVTRVTGNIDGNYVLVAWSMSSILVSLRYSESMSSSQLLNDYFSTTVRRILVTWATLRSHSAVFASEPIPSTSRQLHWSTSPWSSTSSTQD